MTYFKSEVEKMLSDAERQLLHLEKEPENNKIIDNIFRTMHSLKGSASLFGYNNIQYVAHDYENVYELIRDKKIGISSDLIDFTLRGVDLLRDMLLNKDNHKETERLLFELKQYCMLKTTKSKYAGLNKPVYIITFKPNLAVFEKGIDPEKILRDLSKTGEMKVIRHDNGPSWEIQKEKNICHAFWEIYLQTELSQIRIESIFVLFDETEFSITEFRKERETEISHLPEQLIQFYNNNQELREHILSEVNKLTDLNSVQNEANQKRNINEKVNKTNARQILKWNDIEYNSSISVSSSEIDEMYDLARKLETEADGLRKHGKRLMDKDLFKSIENISKFTQQLKNRILDLKFVPIQGLLDKFKRYVRDLSRGLNKEVDLVIEDNGVEIDKLILKAIKNPLLQIIRNSVDHGIETPQEREKLGKNRKGLLKITSFFSGFHIILKIQDDGRGIDLKRVRECAIKKGYIRENQDISDKELLTFIIEPGFTTSENVSIVSGRGVGMDVVKMELNKVKGCLEIETVKGEGTLITFKLPLVSSIIDK